MAIPFSRWKLVLLLVGALGFVALGFWLYRFAEQIRSPVVFELKFWAGAAIGFFGLCAIVAVIKLCDRRPGLVIDDAGLIDNSSGLSAGRIPWSDIKGFTVNTIEKQRILAIEVHDPGKYVRQAHPLKRPVVELNAKHYGSPIQISAHALAIDFDTLLKTITEAHARYWRIGGPGQMPRHSRLETRARSS
jgi:hypothetical protein